MFNYRDSNVTLKRDKVVATGSTVAHEGTLLVSTIESGVEVVKPCSVSSSEKPVGFSLLDNESFTTDVAVENVTIPATAPYTITLSNGNLAGTGAASYTVRVHSVPDAADFTQNAGVGGTQFAAASAGDALAGKLTFNVADAGKALVVYYRFNLTAAQAAARGLSGSSTADGGPGVRSINNTASAQFGHVTVLSGHGEVYTKEVDMLVDWSDTTKTVKTAANGLITLDGAGTDLSAFLRVIKAPTPDDPHVGFAINMTV